MPRRWEAEEGRGSQCIEQLGLDMVEDAVGLLVDVMAECKEDGQPDGTILKILTPFFG
jgi:hypothetical protein